MSRSRAPLRITRLGLALGLVLLASQGQAHGVLGETHTSETICATATYDDAEPMSYGTVEITAPDSKLPFQSGRTDRNGLFCFRPDSPGQWQLTISDEMGHRVRLQTSVSQNMALAPDKTSHEHNGQAIGRANGIVSGIALIFGMTGGLAWWQSRKKLAKLKDNH